MRQQIDKIESFVPGNEVTFIRRGDEFFAHLVELIENARHEIHLQTYIWVADETGKQVSRAMMAAAQRGVDVYIMLDAYGSGGLRRNRRWLQTWQDANVHYRFFGKLFTGRNLNIGRRMHHKLLVVDGRHTIVTGRNIADRYNDTATQTGWLDFAVRVEGPVGIHLRKVALSFWPERQSLQLVYNPPWVDFTPAGNMAVKIAQNDFFRGIYEMSESYRQAFASARKEVLIVGAYFLPGRRIRKALQKASRQGARIRVIFSKHTDVPLANYATQYLYSWLLKNNVEIYEWEESVVHGKVAVVDHQWVTVGSYNLNYLSALESIELNYIINHTTIAVDVESELKQIIEKECQHITPEDFDKSHTVLKQLREWFAYRLYRYAMRVILLFGGRRRRMPQPRKALEE